MRIPSAVLAEVDFEEAVIDELSARNRYLPPPLADWALRGNAEEIAERLQTRMRRGFQPFPHDSVLARKAGRGSRPLPYIPLEDRLVYRALVGTLADRLPAPPGRENYDSFVRGPLEVEDCEYVLKADVTAFYQYVDHERLIDEVVAQTGDDLAITAVVEFLEGGTGRRFGLPQMQAASDVLADTYIDPIRRDLVRSGHRVFRYADDFRVPCESYSQALGSLELIERSAFELGLVLNEAKTSTPRLSTYQASLTEVSRAEAQLFAQLAAEGVTVEDFFASVGRGYGDDENDDDEIGDDIQLPALPGSGHDEPDGDDETASIVAPTDEQLEVATRVVSLWDLEDEHEVDWSAAVWSALLRKSLFTFEIAQDERAVGSAISLLVREPHLTPHICNYLIALGQQDPNRVHAVLDELCANDIVSVWQSLWVAFLAGSVSGTSRHRTHLIWLRDQVNSPHAAVSAQAALALARRGSLPADDAARAYDGAPQAHRTTAALAMAAAHGRAGTTFAHDDQIEGWLAAWAATQSWGKRLGAKRVVKRRQLQR